MKAHLLDSNFPLVSGSDYEALCGKTVPNSHFAFMWDEQSMGSGLELSPLLVCRKCREAEKGKRYVYGLISGETFSLVLPHSDR